ncbi:hypothetical protein [Tenacibaculum maritimum]|uniref:hypothetical protein n=1 Tax=Tenacibaculum maritimum TaxID=107401 RepID=UPI0012E69588|nr:hypothetical protein TMP445_80041 [Tenacibaculum maritimum]
MSWVLKELKTGRTEEIKSFKSFLLKESYYKGMNIDYSVTHNGWERKVTFTNLRNDKTL